MKRFGIMLGVCLALVSQFAMAGAHDKTPTAVAAISAADFEAFKRDMQRRVAALEAENAALETLRRLNTNAQALTTAVSAACPTFLNMLSKDRRESGFRVDRIRLLLGADAEPVIILWLEKLRLLARAKTAHRLRRRHARWERR